MFELKNIISFATMNIEIIGIFIAIIGGLIVSKLLNLKIEKESLQDKLNIINKQILFDNERLNKRKNKIMSNDRAKFIDDIYEHIFEKDFSLEKYNHYGLSNQEAKDICIEIIDSYKKANDIFEKLVYYIDDVEKILSENKIYESDDLYWIYHSVGCKYAKKKNGIHFDIPNVYSHELMSKITSLEEVQENINLNKSFEELNEQQEWRLIEKENIEIKINAINGNLKFDFFTFGTITIFGIIIPQIIISIHALFVNYKFLKYIFAIYSIITFIGSMLLMMCYVYHMYKKIQK